MTEKNNDESDFDLLLDSYKNMKSQSSFKESANPNLAKSDSSKEKEKPAKKFKYGYEILLLQPNENGLMENFLTENIIDANLHNQSDFYNYGLDKDKWLKLINHSILMHYERHLQEEAKKKNNEMNVNQNNFNNLQAQQFYNLMRNNMYNIFQQQNFNLNQKK